MTTFVLVHGAWHGGWCWKKVVPLLRAAGHEVYTPTLTGSGERAHLRSQSVSMETLIQDIVSVIEYENLEDVVLVGHSYGGMMVVGVSDRIPQRLSHLVFLDALIPEDGQSVKTIMPGLYDYYKPLHDAEGGDWYVPIPDASFGITDSEDLRWLRSKLTLGAPLQQYEEPVHLTNPQALALPRTYIRCYENGVISDVAEYEALVSMTSVKGWHMFKLNTGHDAMITVPEELTTILLNIQ